MLTDQQWTERLDRQWAELRRQERIMSIYMEDGLGDEFCYDTLDKRASDYGRSVREAPASALLAHARNVKYFSPSL